MDDESSLRDAGFTEDAMHAVRELHYGRLEWLAYYIRHADYRIHPLVAQKILNLIENNCEEGGEPPYCLFRLQAVRLEGLRPAYRDPQITENRNFAMAVEVARKCKFKRAHVDRAYHEVGQQYGLKATTVRVATRRHREHALGVVAEEDMQAAYDRGEIDIFGRPKSE